MRRLAALSLLLILVSGCATVQKATDSFKLPELTSIATPDNAKRALIIAQSLRVGYRDHVARTVSADGELSDDERAELETFDHRDAIFTEAWRRAHTAVQLWAAVGGESGDFNTNYLALEGIAKEWLNQYGEIGGNQ